MESVKVYWEKEDRFNTIREKLIQLIGKQVANREGSASTIWSVGDVVAGAQHCLFDKTFYYWGFSVEYGQEDSKLNRWTETYEFRILRTGNYEYDLREGGYMVDKNHPFIFYR